MGAFDQRGNGPAFGHGERFDVADLVNEVPVALFGGDPARGGVWGNDEPLFLKEAMSLRIVAAETPRLCRSNRAREPTGSLDWT